MTAPQVRTFAAGDVVTLESCVTLDEQLIHRPAMRADEVEPLPCGCQRLHLPRPGGWPPARLEISVGPHHGYSVLATFTAKGSIPVVWQPQPGDAVIYRGSVAKHHGAAALVDLRHGRWLLLTARGIKLSVSTFSIAPSTP